MPVFTDDVSTLLILCLYRVWTRTNNLILHIVTVHTWWKIKPKLGLSFDSQIFLFHFQYDYIMTILLLLSPSDLLARILLLSCHFFTEEFFEKTKLGDSRYKVTFGSKGVVIIYRWGGGKRCKSKV